MTSDSDQIWDKVGSTGIFKLTGTRGNYLADPDFVDVDWLREMFSEPDLMGIIIKGSGRHFSAGADMSALRKLAEKESQLIHKMNAGKEIIQVLEGTPLPLVAEIHGACFGGGLEIALACHIRICSEKALFAFPEINHGIIPGLGGTVNLSKIIGPGKAAEMILSGDIMSAGKALETGLVDYVVPEGELSSYCLHYLEKMTRDRDGEVIRSVMTSIRNAMTMDTDHAMAEETRLFCRLAARNLEG